MERSEIRQAILDGKTALGLEFGSTRIKAVLITEDHEPVASGGHTWENHYENGIWTYGLDEVREGMQDCYRDLAENVKRTYGVPLETVGSIGFSAMMHGYLAFDAEGNLLAPFRTWRNTITQEAAGKLSALFGFNIPQRWSIAHLYQAILNGEPHVGSIRYLTTLSGYIHFLMTGRHVLGVGDASGMFPIDSKTCTYDARMVKLFDEAVADRGFGWKLLDILPQALPAGADAGVLTESGAKLLDPTGTLRAGIPLCPPEGDAGTGMTATNAVAVRTGNVSAGTSIFAMAVLEKPLSRMYPEIDMVTTPSGEAVAMVHGNNCTSEVNAWTELFLELADLLGTKTDFGALLTALSRKSLEAEPDCGGLVLYNYLSGEPVTGLENGSPLLFRGPDSRFNLANFMRAQLYAALAPLSIGMRILRREHAAMDRFMGHGGFFKTPGVGQRYMAAAMGCPISVMETAGEGGAWGMALLADFAKNRAAGQKLADYLDSRVFSRMQTSTLQPDPRDEAGFGEFLARYEKGLAVEKAAAELVK
jgi:sugar (pentulose or hexulose) kinase